MTAAAPTDPFIILGLSRDAGEAEVRARYLELVKQFPPEREPDKFRQIRVAYEAAKDPLSIAKRLIEPPDDAVPHWSAVLENQKRHLPRIAAGFLLSLGNRSAENSPENAANPPTSV